MSWRQRAVWILGVAAIVVVALGVAAWLALRTAPVQRVICNTVEKRTTAATGMPIQLGHLDLKFTGRSPGVDLNHVVIGTLATIAHVHIGFQITSLLHRTWKITDLEIDHPVVNLDLGAPPSQLNAGGGESSLGNLVIDQIQVRNGVVIVRDQAIAVRAQQLAANLQYDNGDLHVSSASAALLGGSVSASGSLVSGHYSARVLVRGVQLGQIASASQLGMSGTLNADVSIRGAGSDFQVSGTTQASANVAGTPLEALARARYRAGTLQIASATVTAPSLRITGKGTLGRGTSLTLNFSSGNLGGAEAIADRLVATFTGHAAPDLGLSGAGSATVAISGTLADPAVAAHLTLAPWGVHGTRWRSLGATVHASARELNLQDLVVLAPTAGSVRASGMLAWRNWRPEAGDSIRANLQVADLHVQQPQFAADVAATANVAGTLAHPEGSANLTLAHAHVSVGSLHQAFRQVRVMLSGDAVGIHAKGTAVMNAGTITVTGSSTGTLAESAATVTATSPELRIEGQVISGIRVTASLARQRLLATAAASVLQAPITAAVDLGMMGDWPVTASLDAPVVPLGPLLAAYAPLAVQGKMSVHASLRGPLHQVALLQAQVDIPTFVASLGPVSMLAAAPIHAALANGLVMLAPAHFTGTDTDLTVSGTVPLAGETAMNIAANGRMSLQLVSAFAPSLAVSGALVVALRASGTRTAPQVAGDLTLTNVGLTSPDFPVGLDGGHGTIHLQGQRLDIADFTAGVGGGKLDLTGNMTLASSPQFNFALAARQIHLQTPPTLRETLNANLTLDGAPAAAHLGGRVELNEVSPTPDFDFIQLVSDITNETAVTAPPGSFTQNLVLDVALVTPNTIQIASPDFSLAANADLTVRGTAAEPVVLGRVNLNSGDLIFRGNRYTLSAGTLAFANPARTEPTVSVTADTTISQYNLHLHFQGPTDSLHTSYTSDPPLPSADIINLLAFGQTTESAGANPTPGNLGAETLVAGAVTSQITDRVQKVAGISQLSVDPILGTGQQGAGARVTVQQRVTGNLFITFSTDTTGAARDVVEVQYQVSPRVSVTGVRDQNGGFTFSTRIKKIW